MAATIAEIEAEIQRLEPLARADVLARRVKGLTNYWRGSEAKYLAALEDREEAQRREENALEVQEANEFADKVRRIHEWIAGIKEHREEQIKLNAELDKYPESIRRAARAPRHEDASAFSHSDPDVQAILTRKLEDVQVVRALHVRWNGVAGSIGTLEQKIAHALSLDPVLELVLPREFANQFVMKPETEESEN